MGNQQRVFYGWWVVLALSIVGLCGTMARYNITVFFPFISSELGWSRSTIALAQSINLWVYALFVVLSGWMIDRFGSRKTAFLGGLACLAGWLLLSTVRVLWQLYVYYGVIMALVTSTTFIVPALSTVRKWFRKRAGLASGITISVFAIGNAVFSPLLTSVGSSIGWRVTSVIFAFAFGLPIMLIAFSVIRDTPESIGLKPDGEGATEVDTSEPVFVEKSRTVNEAIRTPQLWLLVVVYSLYGVPLYGLPAHLVMWAVDLGSDVAMAGVFMTAVFAPSIITRVGGGYLGDRYGKRQMIMISNLFLALLMLWAWHGVHTTQWLMVLAVGFGLGFSLAIGLYAPFLGDLYGRARVGSLFGIITMVHGLIGGLGPFLWGRIFEISGSYNFACLISAACYAIAAVAAFLIRPPQHAESYLTAR